ncbi:uncharacterized protein B0I36DRAFT_320154 [Microdochium trichocladiopsis]|uniref:Uncharacterized protein n=1 Tax=Microdochium trichocladiopsis TaxID=1682393 RepID=A0A9P9BRI3_9PEZI|nr:uncharacterized protein B0I36DRAFT_320154 [Microdochium trichocladiopsis]KAH7032845.1 hypothetical protein B0I36DRAFT_320154 [Microdochium trichocladiopsis]
MTTTTTTRLAVHTRSMLSRRADHPAIASLVLLSQESPVRMEQSASASGHSRPRFPADNPRQARLSMTPVRDMEVPARDGDKRQSMPDADWDENSVFRIFIFPDDHLLRGGPSDNRRQGQSADQPASLCFGLGTALADVLPEEKSQSRQCLTAVAVGAHAQAWWRC